MDMSSKTGKIVIIIAVIILVVAVIVIFKSQNGSQPNNNVVNDNSNVVKNTDEKVKEQLINDNISDPAVSKDVIENQEFNPALDDKSPDNIADEDDIIEDPEAENL